MVAEIHDAWLEEKIIQDRQDRGIDQFDETWDGTYVIYSPKDNDHQKIRGDLTSILYISFDLPGLGLVLPGANVSDQEVDWTKNYRCPDVVVFLDDTQAENRDTHWLGGPDFAVEIVSPGDRTREKLGFYAKVNTRELLIVDRDPWGLELFRLADGKLVSVGTSTLENAESLSSEVVPLRLRLTAGEQRPQIEVSHADGEQRWVL